MTKVVEIVNISRDIHEKAEVEVSYEDSEWTIPANLEELDDYPKIQDMINHEWGTVRLKEYLENLLASTRNHGRAGFPSDFANSLLRLALANDRALAKRGVDMEEFDSQFQATGWELPRNF